MPSTVSLRDRLNPTFPVERTTLANGLRVVFMPDRSTTAVTVAVYYDVGFRSEPEGRTGFAHLFEHLMFEGSRNVAKLEHARHVQANGGTFNGSTNNDYTNYFEQLPSSALELALFLEADRMAAPNLTAETLENQIAVVKEEIRVNVLNRPFGGFPWIQLPPVMFRTYNNAHNGYGSFEDLSAATVDDAVDFWTRYYAPGNAVLAVVGDADPDSAIPLVERHFGPIDARPVPVLPSFSEPVPGEERRAVHEDPMAPTPAVAIGYRVPDPVADPRAYLATVLLAAVLADGDASRLHRRLVKRDGIATQVSAYVGPFGDALEVRDPTMLHLIVHYPPPAGPEGVLAAIDDEVAGLADDLDEDELGRTATSIVAGYLRQLDHGITRAMTAAVLEQQRGRAELVNEAPAQLLEVSAEDVRRAAKTWMLDSGRAVLDWRPRR